jgi:2-methylcitrate dehydratase
MDGTLTRLVKYIADVDFGALHPSAVDAIELHYLDAVGCGLGAISSPMARTVRNAAAGMTGAFQASTYGCPEPAFVDMAGFVNAALNRYLDFNDFGPVSGHPSDMAPIQIAYGEALGAAGADVVTAIYVSYEIATALSECFNPADNWWDHGLLYAIASAGGIAKLMRLDEEQTANALALAAVSALPLIVTRLGSVSGWKACATGYAAMCAGHLCRLAAAGMSGPSEPFEGPRGLFERVSPLKIPTLADPAAGKSAVERASLKAYPACYLAQSALDAALRARVGVAVDDIAAIDVETGKWAWSAIGGGSGDADSKWRPSTRETADHSLPYIVAVAVLDGTISDESYCDHRLFADAALKSLIARVSVSEAPDLTEAGSHGVHPSRVTLRLRDGSARPASCQYPKGDPDNPMCEREVSDKFARLAAYTLPPGGIDELSDRLRGLAFESSLARIGSLFRSARLDISA